MKHPRQIKRSEMNAENIALLIVRWENYKPTHPFNIIRKDAMLKELRKKLAEFNEKEGSV